MRTKSAYREPAENIPEPPEASAAPDFSNDLPAPPAIESAIEPQPSEPDLVIQAEEAAVKADEAARALKGQIDAHKQAEALQAQHQAAVTAQHVPVTREQKLEAWDLSEAEKRFLTDHPEMIDQDRILAAAIQTATRAGIDRSAPEFLPKVKANFDFHLERFQRQAAAQSPEFFRPEPPRTPSRPSPASYTSAPVSREAPGGDRPLSLPSKITLTAEEKEASRVAGISELEYAKQKARLIIAKSRGEIS